MTDLAQPNATQMPHELLEAVLAAIPSESGLETAEVMYRDQHSNDFAEVRLCCGRALIVKRGRHDWAGSRFETSRIASRLIREATAVAVPAPLPVPAAIDERPVEAYWRLEQPTLQEVWSQLDADQRGAALRSWGELIATLHSVRMEGFGPLADEATPTTGLATFLRAELEGRLLPAVTGEWPAALPSLHRLIRAVDEVAGRAGERSRLVHNDMHMGNVLCEVSDDDDVRCVGLIDLETALAGPPEADVAIMEVQHGDLFGQPVEAPWIEGVKAGYTEALDPVVVNFYRAFHLINMGFYSALIGHDWHAQQVAAAAARETAELELALATLTG
ncbi:MAG: aminoglycoside phosphotransferase family protein [Gemmatimonadota bacterium]